MGVTEASTSPGNWVGEHLASQEVLGVHLIAKTVQGHKMYLKHQTKLLLIWLLTHNTPQKQAVASAYSQTAHEVDGFVADLQHNMTTVHKGSI